MKTMEIIKLIIAIARLLLEYGPYLVKLGQAIYDLVEGRAKKEAAARGGMDKPTLQRLKQIIFSQEMDPTLEAKGYTEDRQKNRFREEIVELKAKKARVAGGKKRGKKK